MSYNVESMMRSTLFLKVALGCVASVFAATPVLAEIDFSGQWAGDFSQDYQERLPGPNAVEYYGLPINEDARARALSFKADVYDLYDHQCLYYQQYYLFGGPGIRLWTDADPDTNKVIAWNINGNLDRAPMKIWMDGRASPGPLAPHTNSGFSTGKWDGDTLVVHTTHMKEGYLRRNGVPASDQASMTLFITRNDDLLTITGLVDDPVYLTETYVISRIWKYSTSTVALAPTPCTPAVELPGVDSGSVPNNLPGKNPDLNEMTRLYHIPLDAVLGGAATMYPEYRKKLSEEGYSPPTNYCTRYCCGSAAGTQPALRCNFGLGF